MRPSPAMSRRPRPRVARTPRPQRRVCVHCRDVYVPNSLSVGAFCSQNCHDEDVEDVAPPVVLELRRVVRRLE